MLSLPHVQNLVARSPVCERFLPVEIDFIAAYAGVTSLVLHFSTFLNNVLIGSSRIMLM